MLVPGWLAADRWLVLESASKPIFDAICARAEALDRSGPLSRQATNPGDAPRPLYGAFSGVALIGIQGLMVRDIPAWASWVEEDGLATSMTRARQAVLQAAADPAVKGIMLLIRSPGGSVDGTQELAHAVKAAVAVKPVRAHALGLAASAAYWVGSQAAEFTAGPETALVGSIGVITSFYDWSQALANEGIKAEVVRSGPAKGGVQFGEPVTDEARARIQTIIDDTAAIFAAEVAAGRGARIAADRMPEIRTGDVWIAGKAKGLGLIDQVTSDAEALHALVSATAPKGPIMSIWSKLFPSLSKAEIEEAKAALDAAAGHADVTPEKLAAEKAELQAKQLAIESERARERYLAEAQSSTFATLAGTAGEIAADLEAIDQLPTGARERARQRLAAAAAQVSAASALTRELGAIGAQPTGAVAVQDSIRVAALEARAKGMSAKDAALAAIAANKSAYREARKLPERFGQQLDTHRRG